MVEVTEASSGFKLKRPCSFHSVLNPCDLLDQASLLEGGWGERWPVPAETPTTSLRPAGWRQTQGRPQLRAVTPSPDKWTSISRPVRKIGCASSYWVLGSVMIAKDTWSKEAECRPWPFVSPTVRLPFWQKPLTWDWPWWRKQTLPWLQIVPVSWRNEHPQAGAKTGW